MPYGLNPVIANQELASLLTGAAFTPPAGSFAQLHNGDPGVAGTNNLSSVTTRISVPWGAPVNGVISTAGLITWGTWAGASPEVIAGLSFWSAVAAGTFIFSAQLSAPVTIQTGNPLTLPTLSYTRGPVAA